MINPLANLYNTGSSNFPTKTTTPSNIPQMQAGSLPSSGEDPYLTKTAGAPPASPIFSGGNVPPPPTLPADPATPENDLYAKYRDPKTGEVMTPEEYAVYLGNKAPKGTGQIPNYAGDAMTKPGESSEDLIKRATALNNARNAIATGTADPYGVGSQSGIAYSPSELKAIESAYAGVYDPALNDVFARLRDRKSEEDKLTAREERVFATNESIRQWQATTGSKKSGGGGGSGSGDTKFTQTQINKGAGIAGMSINAFADLDDEVKNFYYNSPVSKALDLPMNEVFSDYYDQVSAGDFEAQEMVDLINSSNLSQIVKMHAISLIPVYKEDPDEGIDWFWKSKW